jgi:hypothetical protein
MTVYGFIRYKEWRTVAFVRNLILSGVVAVVLLSPVAYHTYLLLKSPTGSSFSAEEAFYTKNAAEITDYLRVAPLNRLVLRFLGNSPIISPYSRATPGWSVLMLFIPGLIFVMLKRPPKFGILLFLGLAFFLLSLGPTLSLTKNYRLPLPFQLISGIPILSHARIPDRFAIMVNLVMAIIAGYGLSLLAAKLSNSGRKAIYIGAFSLLLFELATIPFPMEAFDPPKVFYQLAQNKGNGMLSLPFYPGNIRAKLYMRFQSIHQQKLLDGRVSRNPWMPINYIKDLSIAKSFRAMTRGDAIKGEDVELDRQFAPLFREFFNLRSVAIYPPFSNREDIRKYVGTVFPDAKLLSDEKGIFVYELPRTQTDSFQYSKQDYGIRFFLLENWQFDRRSQQIVCRRNFAKILIPPVEADRVALKLFLRGKGDESKVNFQIGDSFIAKELLKRQIHPVKMEIPSETLKSQGHILQLNLDGKNTTMEIHGLEMKVVRK